MIAYTAKEKKILSDKISLLSPVEHFEIYKILTDNKENIQFTKNVNGIFFNLSSINDSLISKIDDFVNFCYDNKKTLDEYDKKLHHCRNIHINLGRLYKESVRKKDNKENWNIVDNTSLDKISSFINNVINEHDKCLNKKKGNTRFNTARKKYSKKIGDFSDIKIDNLKKEEYYDRTICI